MNDISPSTSDTKSHWEKKADAWSEWADPMQVMAAKFNTPLLDAAKLTTGQHVLDLASGAGEPAISASQIVGPTGFCCATDFVPQMLEGIQKRKGAEGLIISAADMQALPFTNCSFDRIICRFGIMFAPDTNKVISELHRVLRPNGRIALMVWGKREDQTLFQCFSNAIETVCGIKPDAHHYNIFRFGKEGSLSKYFNGSHFINIEESLHNFSAKILIEKPFWKAQLNMSFSHILKDLDFDQKEKLDMAIKSELMKTQENGKYVLTNNIRILTASLAY